jgi:prolyl oligopeptidase
MSIEPMRSPPGPRSTFALVFGLAALVRATAGVANAQTLPVTPRTAQVDVFGRDTIADPYRWLEEMTSSRVAAWARAQDAYARSWIARSRLADSLHARIAAAANHELYTSPVSRSGRYFYSRWNSSGTRIALLMRDGLHGKEIVIVDPDELAHQGLAVDLSFWPSPDGRILAYGVSERGSRWVELRFRDVATGRDLPDRVHGLQGRRLSQVSWTPNAAGVLYDAFDLPTDGERLTASLAGSRVAYHALGTPAADDLTLIAAPEGGRVGHHATDSGEWSVVTESHASGVTRLLAIPGDSPHPDHARVLFGDSASSYSLVGGHGSEIWLYTNRDAPNGRVVGVDIANPRPAHWRDVVPEAADPIDTWTGAAAVGGAIVTGYRHQGALALRISDPLNPDAGSRPVPLPTLGSVWFGVTGRQGSPEFFYQLSGFADPGTVYRHDLVTHDTKPYLTPDLPYDPDEIVTRQVFYRNAAGRPVPMLLAHHRATPPNGARPVMIYGYAFGNWSASPWFRPHMGTWFAMGGTFALPALRGGGEFGAAWAAAGLGVHRQNAIDDFVAAGQWLVEERLATPKLLVAESNSAGASVVGAAVVQQPRLFAAGVLGFPLLDVLRYERYTAGARWRSQLGSVENAQERSALLGYAPIQSVKQGVCYPPVLITPGEKDETTPPFHAYKLVAALQAADQCSGPALLRISWGAGHAYGRDQETTLRNFADQLAFLTRVLPTWTQTKAPP